MGFPAEAICSGQQVRDRTDISMTKDLFKSGGSCFPPSPPPPPPSALLHAPGLLPRGAPQLDCKKRDHFKETRCARVSLAALTPITSSRLSSLSQSPPFSPIPTERERSDFSSSLAFRALPCASLPCFIHTPRRQSELHPDWRQTNKARGSGRHRSSCCSWRSEAERKTRNGAPPRRGPDPDANDDDARFSESSRLVSCLPRYHASVNARRSHCCLQ